MILTNARILTLDGANRILDSGEVEIASDGRISAVDEHIREEGVPVPEAPAPEVFDCRGKVLMPALINCHTHLYSSLARGLPLRSPKPREFTDILKKIWWRLDRALNPDDVYHSAMAGLVDSAKSGVATVIDHHSSPKACPGSLDRIADAFREVGLRGSLCYETSDRNGPAKIDEAIRENVRFLETNRDPMLHGAFGLHAAFTLSDQTLRRCVEANQSLHAPFHVHVAEADCDLDAVHRFSQRGVLDEKTLAAHGVRLSHADRKMMANRGVNIIHNPQSNVNNDVGISDVQALIRNDLLVGLGSDGYTARLWDEFRTAWRLQREGVAPQVLLGSRAIMKKAFGLEIGRIEPGASADLMLVDYYPPTPLDGENLFHHVVSGIASAPVEGLMVNGRWILREGHMLHLDEQTVFARAAAQAKSLWERF